MRTSPARSRWWTGSTSGGPAERQVEKVPRNHRLKWLLINIVVRISPS
jgi:hypothetical protein